MDTPIRYPMARCPFDYAWQFYCELGPNPTDAQKLQCQLITLAATTPPDISEVDILARINGEIYHIGILELRND